MDVPEITESVSEKDGIITITLNNASLTETKDLEIRFAAKEAKELVEAKVVTAGVSHAFNSFEAPETVVEADFEGVKADGDGFKLTLPKASVVMLRVKA